MPFHSNGKKEPLRSKSGRTQKGGKRRQNLDPPSTEARKSRETNHNVLERRKNQIPRVEPSKGVETKKIPMSGRETLKTRTNTSAKGKKEKMETVASAIGREGNIARGTASQGGRGDRGGGES